MRQFSIAKLLLSLLIIVCLAVAGCKGVTPEPTKGSLSRNSEYTILTSDRGEVLLLLVGQWEGQGNKEVEFDSNGPLIVDYQATSESSVSSDFKVSVGKREGKDEWGIWYMPGPTYGTSTSAWTGQGVGKGLRYFVVGASGHFKLSIESHGCKWLVRIGKEK